MLLQNSNVNRQAIVPTYVLYFHVKNLEYTIYALSSICIFCKGTIYLVLFSFRKINFLQLKNDPFLNYIASPFSMYVCSLPHMCHLTGIVLVGVDFAEWCGGKVSFEGYGK